MLTFFGERGDKNLDLKHFAAFCADLHAELVRLEFLHYDYEGAVCGHLLLKRTCNLASHIVCQERTCWTVEC